MKSQSQQPANPLNRGAVNVTGGNPVSTGAPTPGGTVTSQPVAGLGGVSSSNPMFGAVSSSHTFDPNAGNVDANGHPIDWSVYGPNGPAFTPAERMGLVSNGATQTAAGPTAPSPSIQPPLTQNVATASNVPGAPPPPAPPPSVTPGAFNPANSQLFPGGNISNVMQQAQDAAYKQATGYLDPQFANQEASLRSQLLNQGIPENSEAWNKAMDDFNRQKTFAYSQAENGAYGQGLQAQNQVAQQLLAQMGLGTQYNTALLGAGASEYGSQLNYQTLANQLAEQHQQNLFNNSMGMRTQDINELLLQQENPLQIANLLTNGQNVQTPNFTSTPATNVSPTDIAQIIQQATQQGNNVFNSQVGATNSQNAGMAAIVAALLSDRRLKTNIQKIGMHKCGVPLYSYNYVSGEPGFGVLADELEQVRPDAVWEDENGFKVVNYAAISEME